MTKVEKMWAFFDIIDGIISQMSEDDDTRRQLLDEFFVQILSVLDGVQGNDLKWKGLRLVAPEDLKDSVEEVNDEFLHEAWSNR